jgi:cytochrome c556
MRRKVALFGIAAVCLTGMAQAADAPNGLDIIALRQSGQALVGGDFTGILQAAKNKVPDVKPFAPAALAIVKWEKLFVQMFPPGSDHGDKTRALPAIWTNRAEFEKDAADLSAAAEKLGNITKANDRPGFAPQVKVVGEACIACHKRFRAK